MFFIRTVFLFFKLNFLKALLYPVIVSAKDWDRLRFEWELCRISAERSDVLFVGVHSRSFAYELVLPFDFIDIDDNFLIKGLTNVSVGRCEEVTARYELVILSGVLDFGTDDRIFRDILLKENFERFLILDRTTNMNAHKRLFGEKFSYKSLNNVFYYYYDRT